MSGIKSVPRKVDEENLDVLYMRAAGWTWKQIAAKNGHSLSAARTVVKRVQEADIKHDPDAAHFWSTAHNPTPRQPPPPKRSTPLKNARWSL